MLQWRLQKEQIEGHYANQHIAEGTPNTKTTWKTAGSIQKQWKFTCSRQNKIKLSIIWEVFQLHTHSHQSHNIHSSMYIVGFSLSFCACISRSTTEYSTAQEQLSLYIQQKKLLSYVEKMNDRPDTNCTTNMSFFVLEDHGIALQQNTSHVERILLPLYWGENLNENLNGSSLSQQTCLPNTLLYSWALTSINSLSGSISNDFIEIYSLEPKLNILQLLRFLSMTSKNAGKCSLTENGPVVSWVLLRLWHHVSQVIFYLTIYFV